MTIKLNWHLEKHLYTFCSTYNSDIKISQEQSSELNLVSAAV